MAALAAAVGVPSLAGSSPMAGTSAATQATDTLAVPLDSFMGDANPFDRTFIDAVCQQAEGKDSLAEKSVEEALRLNPNAAEAYFLRSKLASGDSASFADIQRAATLQPGNSMYQEIVAGTFIDRKEYKRAITAYEQLYDHNRDRSDVLHTLVGLYVATRDYDHALQTLDRMERIDGESEDLMFLRMQLYEQRGDTKNAYRTLAAVVGSHPYEPNYKVMLGNWLMQHDRKDEAFKQFKDALALDPQNAFTLTSLYDYYNSVGDKTAADNLRDDMLLSPQTTAKNRQKMLLDYIMQSERKPGTDSVAVLALIDRTMKAAPHDADISNLKAMYMQLKKMPHDSVNAAYEHTLAIAPDNSEARSQLIQNNWGNRKYTEKLALEGTQYNPTELLFYYFLGSVYMQESRDDEAMATLRRGLGEVNSNSNSALVSDMYAVTGDLLYNKGLVDEAFAAYDSCLQWKEDNMMALNNYAYYLSEHKRDLKKAEKMSRTTIDDDPTNSTYLDTYAWILFLEKRYDEAKAYIDRALENDSDSVPSAVVVEHAGDIYCLSGDTARAAELWQKAIDCGGDKAVLSRKIKNKRVE